MKQLESGVSRKRVGLLSTGAPARGHSDILGPDGKKVSDEGTRRCGRLSTYLALPLTFRSLFGAQVGEITSGAVSPCLMKNVSMGCARGSNAGGLPLLSLWI